MSGSEARARLCQLLRCLPIDKQIWAEAAGVLINDLRKDAAMYGLTDLTYREIKDGLEALGLAGDEFRLYGYATVTVEEECTADFQRVIDPAEELRTEDSAVPIYGPYAVYYSPVDDSGPEWIQVAPVGGNAWSARISTCLKHFVKPRLWDLERGGTT